MNVDEAPMVYDGLFEEKYFDELTQFFFDTSWKFGWRSNTIGDSLLHWNKHIAGGGKNSREPCDTDLLSQIDAGPVARAWATIKEALLPDHSLIRCYGNAHTFGLDGTIHRDNPKDIPMVTTLVYCHRIWPLPWGGETLFYSDDCENINATIFPKPGRVVVFPGSIPHAAKSPSRVCKEPRISLVFKSIRTHDLYKMDSK